MYWQTSLIVTFLMFIYILVSWSINRHFRWVTTFNLVLVSLLVALSIVLTNLVGYSRILFGKQIELGNFLILVVGMMFGPWAGLVAAIASDLMGSLIFLGGTFHIGFMVTKIGFGLAGALVFNGFLLNWWRLKLLILISSMILIQLFFVHPLALYGTMVTDWETLWARFFLAMPGKLITLAIEIVLYPFLSFITFRVLYLLYNHHHQASKLWTNRYNEINFSWPRLKLKWSKKYDLKKLENEMEENHGKNALKRFD